MPHGLDEVVERTEFLDANLICRYLTDDHPELSPRAAALIDSDHQLRISLLMLAEAAQVLRSFYRRAPDQIADALIRLLERSNIRVHEVDTDHAIQALQLTRPSRRISVPHALLWAIAQAATPALVWSFDRKFPREGIDLVEP